MTVLFAISDQAAVYNERIAISLGMMTLALALATFASCRSCVRLLVRFGLKDPAGNIAYQSFYRYHAYYWWFFGVSAVSHALMATFHTGLPEAGDPDANIHWIILVLGFTSALSSLGLFSSCRVYPVLLARALPKLSVTGSSYKLFFNYHAYYWLVFAILVAGHFLASYLHAGIWPGADSTERSRVIPLFASKDFRPIKESPPFSRVFESVQTRLINFPSVIARGSQPRGNLVSGAKNARGQGDNGISPHSSASAKLSK